jgi:hypothetical protein
MVYLFRSTIISSATGLLFGVVAALLSEARAEPVAKAISLEGMVVLHQLNAEHILRVGDPIEKGSEIRTSRGAAAKILMADQTIVDIGPNSSLKVNEFAMKSEHERNVELGVDFGTVRASVNKKLQEGGKFQIRTKTSVFAVRGTEFVVNSADKSVLTVLEGKVEADALMQGSTASAMVDAGKQVSVGKQGLSQIALLSPSALQSLTRASRIEDQTFRQAIVISDPVKSRRMGNSTFGVLASRVKLPSVSVPVKTVKTPGVFTPDATLISGSLSNYYPVSVKVNFQ